MAELRAEGVRPEDVDTVFITHPHPDHVGWNLSREGTRPRATFPKARYLFHRADWDTWGKPEVQTHIPFKFWEETLGPLENLGILELQSGDRALTSEVTAIPTPGHAPGHMSLVIVSGGQRAMILGDMAVNPAQLTNPDWGFAFDMDQALAAQTRRRFLDRAEAENTTLIQCHMPAPGFGRLVRIRGRRYWKAL
jgi:glyoxylase-like metal-dependent hydrolase (beta-lactamase superfamily II)